MKPIRTTRLPRTAVSFVLTGALAAMPVVALAPTVARADTSDDLQAQLDAALSDLDDLQAAYDQATANLGKTTYDLEQTRAQISDLEDQIAETQSELAAARSELAASTSTYYKQGGNTSLLELVLNASDFEDLISRVYYADKVTSSQEESIQTIVDLQSSLESDQAALREQEQQQEQLVSSQEAEQAAAQQAAAQQESYVNQLSTEVQQALEEERERAAEESRKRAEQALAEQQQQEQSQGADTSTGGSNAGTGSTGTGSNAGTGTTTGGSASTGGSSNAGASSGAPSGGGSSSASSSQRQTAVNAALAQVGKPYGHANDGTQWDCNGLTHYAWAQAGVSIPASSGTYAYGQFQWMKSSGRWVTSTSQLQPGDLVFYSRDGGATCYHVALYIGGGQVVHAEGYGRGVTVVGVTYCSGFCGGGSPI